MTARSTAHVPPIDHPTTPQFAAAADAPNMEMTIEQLIPACDHTIVILRVTNITVHDDVTATVFHRSTFRRLSS